MKTWVPTSHWRALSGRSISVLNLTRTGLLAIIGALLIGAGLPVSALTQEEGEHILQCSCPVWWDEPWEGTGVFDEDESLDTVVLTNGRAVLLIQEILIDDGTLAGMIQDRTGILEAGNNIANLEETWTDETETDAFSGRTWENRGGDTIYSFQFVQVWETNFLLSIEFVAPEADFVEEWDSLEFVLLVGTPILGEFDGAEIADQIGPDSLKPN
jgi:hypothetical protein